MKRKMQISVSAFLAVLLMASAGACQKGDSPQSSLSSDVSASQSEVQPIVVNHPNTRGNTPENQVNVPIVAEQDGYLYYVLRNENGNGDSLWRENEETGERAVLFTSETESFDDINVVGEWVYFDTYYTIRKVKVDGSETDEFAPDPDDPSATVEHIQVVDGYIYFTIIYESESSSGKSAFIRMDLDGQNREVIDDVRMAYFLIMDDWIYGYKADDIDHLVRMKVDGSEETLMSEEKLAGTLFWKDGWIYTGNGSIYSETGAAIYKIKADGSEREILYESEGSMPVYYQYEDYVYFINQSSESDDPLTIITRTTVDDWEREKEVEVFNSMDLSFVPGSKIRFNIGNVNFIGDKMYFTAPNDMPGGTALYRMDLDGGNLEVVNENGKL